MLNLQHVGEQSRQVGYTVMACFVFFPVLRVRSLGKIALISVIGFVGQHVGDGKSQKEFSEQFSEKLVEFVGLNCCCCPFL